MSNINEWVRQAKAGDPDAFDNVVGEIKPLMDRRISFYSSKSNLPKNILEIDAITNVQTAIQKFNPDRGIDFQTYVRPYIDKVRRTAYQYANIGSIPEHRITQINTFRQVRDDLVRRLHRHPSSNELADELGWATKEVDRMQKELKTELIMDSGNDAADQLLNEKEKDILHYIRFELPPDEQAVYERVTGLITGNPMSPQEVARDLKMPVTQVYNLKTKLSKRIEPLLQNI